MLRAFGWGLLMGALVPSFAMPARADDQVSEREAQARFEEGVARVKAGNLEGARTSFAQAYALLRKPTILWNLALAEEKTGHSLEALNHFRELARGAQTSDDRGNAEKHVAALMAQTGHLDVAAPAGTQLFVDGEAVAVLPLAEAADVTAGFHHLEVKTAQGAHEAEVEVGPGQLLHVSLIPPAEMPRPTAAPPSPREDGALPGRASNTREGSQPSGHSAAQVVAVVLGGTVAAVSVALGAYFALQTQSDQNTVEGFRQQYGNNWCFRTMRFPCTQWNDSVQGQSRDAALSDVFYVAGGAFAIGALAAWIFWPRSGTGGEGASLPHGSFANLALTPTVRPDGAGLIATGGF